MEKNTQFCPLIGSTISYISGNISKYPFQDTLDSMGIFVPGIDTMIRGEFSMTVMELSSNQHLSTVAQSPFSDVPSYREDAAAIGVINQLGLLSGNGDGTFAPDRHITVGETVTALLRLLEYSASEIGFCWPEDYVSKAQSIGLLDHFPTDPSATFNQDMTSQLLYNLICLETKTGEIYGEQMAASVVRDVVLLSNHGSNGGSVDQLSVVVNGVTAYYSKEKDFPTELLASGRGLCS